jgi:hypothetical protein
MDTRLEKAVESLAARIVSPERIDAERRVRTAINSAGEVIQTPRPFILLRSPDGSVWRVKVSDTGALSSVKVS